MDEVINWFDKNNIEFLGSVPDADIEGSYIGLKNMHGNRGTLFTRIASQLGMLFSTAGGEGGLFLVIGKKK